MTRFLKVSLLAFMVVLTGCAANVQRSGADTAPLALATGAKSQIVLFVSGSDAAANSSDWELMRAEWRTSMASAAAARGISFVYQDAPSKSTVGAGTLVNVKVKDYRFISTGARYAMGVFSGNAYVNTDITFSEAKSGRVIGTRKYDTSSNFMQGIFAPMTSKQVEAMCTEIVKEVAGL
jgi:hypothetical protein